MDGEVALDEEAPNSPGLEDFLEGKKLSVESRVVHGALGMWSGSDRDLEAGHTFLHFISGMRTSCGVGTGKGLQAPSCPTSPHQS